MLALLCVNATAFSTTELMEMEGFGTRHLSPPSSASQSRLMSSRM